MEILNLNTSYVNVNHWFVFWTVTAILNLNTSYVNVNRKLGQTILRCLLNLNTSYVNVNRFCWRKCYCIYNI